MSTTNIRPVPSPDAAPRPLRVAETLRGKRVLVTGVTGFLGKVWLSQILHDLEDIGHVYVVARPAGADDAAARVRAIAACSPALRPLRERHGAGLDAFLKQRVSVVEADLGAPDAAAALAGCDIDAAVHFAGLTNFDPDPGQACDTNIRGAMALGDVAAKAGVPLVHISTCFVVGMNSGRVAESITPGVSPNGKTFDPAAELDALTAIAEQPGDKRARIDAARARAQALGWPNIYTFSKGLAEHLLAAREDLDCTIVRPAIVECATDYPFAGWNEGINTTGPLVYVLRGFFRHFPSRETNHYDVIPVDHASRAVTAILAAALTGTAERVYHLGSSDDNPMTVGRGLELCNLAIRKGMGRPERSRTDRFLRRFYDAVHVDADSAPALSPKQLRGAAKGVGRFLERLDLRSVLPKQVYNAVGKPLERQQESLGFLMHHADKSFERLQRMLDMYRPFIHDHDWVFETGHMRALHARLSDAERAPFGWHVAGIDWRHYWMDVLYPGLERWCLPLFDGEDAPLDAAHPHPLTFGGEMTEADAASATDAAATAKSQTVSHFMGAS